MIHFPSVLKTTPNSGPTSQIPLGPTDMVCGGLLAVDVHKHGRSLGNVITRSERVFESVDGYARVYLEAASTVSST